MRTHPYAEAPRCQ